MLAFLLLASLWLATLPAAMAATSHVTTISNATADETHWMEAFDAPSAALADFDGDGEMEIVAHNDNQYLYVLASQSSRVLAELRPDYPSGWGVRPINSPTVADVDADGKLDIVVVNSAAYVCVFEHEGGYTFEREWCTRMDRYDGGGAAADAGAWVEDVDGDGRMEIFAQTEKVGLFAINHDGSVRWSREKPGGNGEAAVADLDNDGRKEAVFFGDGGEIVALDADDGWTKWSYWASSRVWPASIPVGGSLGDVDGDGLKEVVFVARDAEHTDDYQKNDFVLFVLDHRGSVQWTKQPTWGQPMSYTHPILEDITGDGVADILLQDWNTMGHKPGNWEQLGPANVFAYNGWGTLLWRTQLTNSWSNDDLALADVDGDGRLEVLAIGFASSGEDGVWYLDARTGAKEGHVGVGSGWTVLRGPVLGDLDGTDRIGWAISVHSSSRGGAYVVFQTDAACSGIVWAHWQARDSCGRSGGTPPPPPPPPPSGDFDATFDAKGGNEWWVQVDVDANQALAGVDARANGGAWHALTLRSWGDWAGSFHVPDGSIVEFRARSTSGESEISGGYVWPSGEPATGDGGDGGGDGTFTATFDAKGGNEWWVQVGVDANQDLRGVDARANGGSWHALTLRDWGDWAGSFHVPDGSIVEFRATSTSGATITSQGYVWPSGEPASGGGGGGDGGTFDATFSNARGNEWWVEVDVSASGGTLAGVDARANGGAWQTLEHKSWGSWARSMHAPPGSTVEFRARATDGATDVSGTYTWPPG